MLRYLLDTNIVSQPISKAPAASVLRKLRSVGEQCAIAAPVWHELQYGCRRLPESRRREALEDYIADVVRASFPILPYDEVAARRHAAERARMEEAGTIVPFVDGQIAAIALVNELVLVTGNVRDFTPFSGLIVENWA
ncbi:MAG: type II toxin-antitoxin system VapC family toxin [Steroidobacter sp.]